MTLEEFRRILPDRLRAIWLQASGVKCGQGVRVGAGSRLEGPGSFAFGDRVHLECDVYLKCVSRGAALDVGRRTFLGNGVEFDLALPCIVGDDVLIAPRVFVTDHHRVEGTGLIPELGVEEAPVLIEPGAWVGAHAVILKGVRIGQGAVVGAGAVVTRSVANFEVVAGVPAKHVRWRYGETAAGLEPTNAVKDERVV